MTTHNYDKGKQKNMMPGNWSTFFWGLRAYINIGTWSKRKKEEEVNKKIKCHSICIILVPLFVKLEESDRITDRIESD
jgi:hypothetical protein